VIANRSGNAKRSSQIVCLTLKHKMLCLYRKRQEKIVQKCLATIFCPKMSDFEDSFAKILLTFAKINGR